MVTADDISVRSSVGPVHGAIVMSASLHLVIEKTIDVRLSCHQTDIISRTEAELKHGIIDRLYGDLRREIYNTRVAVQQHCGMTADRLAISDAFQNIEKLLQ